MKPMPYTVTCTAPHATQRRTVRHFPTRRDARLFVGDHTREHETTDLGRWTITRREVG